MGSSSHRPQPELPFAPHVTMDWGTPISTIWLTGKRNTLLVPMATRSLTEELSQCHPAPSGSGTRTMSCTTIPPTNIAASMAAMAVVFLRQRAWRSSGHHQLDSGETYQESAHQVSERHVNERRRCNPAHIQGSYEAQSNMECAEDCRGWLGELRAGCSLSGHLSRDACVQSKHGNTSKFNAPSPLHLLQPWGQAKLCRAKCWCRPVWMLYAGVNRFNRTTACVDDFPRVTLRFTMFSRLQLGG
jgi:hypothetical protein